MKTIKLAMMAAAAGMAMMSIAQAADMDTPAPQSYDNSGFYLRGDIGWSFLTWSGGDDDSSIAVGGGAGYRFNDNLRTDLRLDWAGDYNIGGGDDIAVTTILGNLYFDIPTGTMVTPYLGAGAGYGWGAVDGGSDKDGFAYALMAGIGVDVSENMVLDVGYRFRDVVASGSDPMEQQILVGLRFGF
jgi:opacity protein-like surface antigen